MPMHYIIFLVLIVSFVLFQRLNNRGIVQASVDSAHEMIKDRSIVIIDVRTPPEFQGGYIKGAILIPVGEIAARVGSFVSYKDRQVLVYCLTGNRSMAASRILRRNGFNAVSNFKGGINAWKANGFTVVKGNVHSKVNQT
jgi:rhodanese-related sulfurtransferase